MNNSKNSILLVDPEFDPNTASDCNLLLKITADSFSYAIIDKHSRQLKAVFDQQECEDTTAELATALKRDSYLSLSFREIKVSVYTPNTIAIPNSLFNRNELNSYANFFAEASSANLYTRPFAKFGFTSVFNFEQFIEETLDKSLASAARYEHHTPLLALGSAAKGTSLLLDFTVGSFNVLLLENRKMIFQNTFQIDTPEEFNYYLLLLIQELKLDPSCSTVLLSGIIHQDDGYYSCLSKYFGELHFNLPPADQFDHAILDDMPAHYYSSLLALDLCV
ncbi:Protein of unknown function [Pedobacter westerhofensis]|uniref:DUF3822 domain-containing protein n=1 Tax=Pedobacter westerhofensis TaxID=425512 RepID=A0A521EZC8_9SPHI|nr:DUF3822 family protein [Pedobacter westerhofensis]SMO88801.1 Protein of unknown function [Pedobacter westerhofensis]